MKIPFQSANILRFCAYNKCLYLRGSPQTVELGIHDVVNKYFIIFHIVQMRSLLITGQRILNVELGVCATLALDSNTLPSVKFT